MSQNFNLDPQSAPSHSEAQGPLPGSASGFGSGSRPPQFYSPPPSATPPTTSASSSGSRRRVVVFGALVAVALGAAAWYGAAMHSSSPPNNSISPVAAASQVRKIFSVSAAEADLKATEQLKAILSGDSSNPSNSADSLRAVNGRALAELGKTNPEMADQIKSGRRVLYRVHLLDFLDEDGDHAELFFNGVGLGDVYLRNAGSEILIPLIADVPTQMKLVATADGGGGVTVGFISSLGEARTRIMQVGESEEWQVTVR